MAEYIGNAYIPDANVTSSYVCTALKTIGGTCPLGPCLNLSGCIQEACAVAGCLSNSCGGNACGVAGCLINHCPADACYGNVCPVNFCFACVTDIYPFANEDDIY